MTCASCYGEAVVATPMRNAPDVSLFTCASCGLQWSALGCDTRNCRERAVVRCILTECGKFRCRGHGAGASGQCAACVRRVARLLKPAPRRTRWHRTGALSDDR